MRNIFLFIFAVSLLAHKAHAQETNNDAGPSEDECFNNEGEWTCKLRKCSAFECPSGFYCNTTENLCYPTPCYKKICGPGKKCQVIVESAQCIDVCKGIVCPEGSTCGENGDCIDCYKRSCLSGMYCSSGECVKDLCYEVQCKSTHFCRNGQCHPLCSNVLCKTGEICVEGQCKADNCLNISCSPGYICVEGKCVSNICAPKSGANCKPRQYCDYGTNECKDDPCLKTHCPPNTFCFMGECYNEKRECVDGTKKVINQDCYDTKTKIMLEYICKDGKWVQQTNRQCPVTDTFFGCRCSSSNLFFSDFTIYFYLILLFFYYRRKNDHLKRE